VSLPEASPSASAGQDKEAAMAAIASVVPIRIDMASHRNALEIRAKKVGNNRVWAPFSLYFVSLAVLHFSPQWTLERTI
jgi:hypothetical protein